ncbi:M16 family metallopeptidase [Shewanella goraebulensis]|uniref:M16 family metallopeptidase n=1 Tax=Shewanella goraebulensis TaxID=3050637 RepID=UPI00254C5B8F|nr:pitrilysin family protein [Shewanella goraebulensis]
MDKSIACLNTNFQKSSLVSVLFLNSIFVLAVSLLPFNSHAFQCDLKPQFEQLRQIEQQISLNELDNGMIVRQVNRPLQSTVAIASQFNVGSRNETEGQTGYAHLFEHLLFKGSENAPKDSYPQQMSAIGARFNASTHFDYTNYYLTIPAQALELSLFLESDRFIRPVLSQTTVKNQQGAVLEEMATTIDNQPYLRPAMEFLLSQVAESPYAHAIIGSKADVISATPIELEQFHQRYYRPDAMQLSLVGKLESDSLQTVKQYFADWQAPNHSQDTFTSIAVTPMAIKTEIVDGRGPWPALLMAWHTVGRNHPDYEAINLLQNHLFQNLKSALASNTLENPPQMLSYSIPLTMENHGVTNLVLVPRANTSLNELQELVASLFNEVMQTGINEQALCGLKAAAINKAQQHYTNSQSLAKFLSNTSVRDKYHPITQPWQRTEAVSSADIQRVTKQYFIDKAVRVDLLPPWYIRWGKALLEIMPQGFANSLERWAL